MTTTCNDRGGKQKQVNCNRQKSYFKDSINTVYYGTQTWNPWNQEFIPFNTWGVHTSINRNGKHGDIRNTESTFLLKEKVQPKTVRRVSDWGGD